MSPVGVILHDSAPSSQFQAPHLIKQVLESACATASSATRTRRVQENAATLSRMARLERELKENDSKLQRLQAQHDAEVSELNDVLIAAKRDIQIRDDMLVASKDCLDADELRLKDLEVCASRFRVCVAP